MICPTCNQQLPDDSKACPMCGMVFEQPSNQNTVQMQAAEKEYKKFVREDSSFTRIVGMVVFFSLTIVFLFSKHFGTAFICFLFACFIYGVHKVKKDRKNQLKNLSEGKKMINLCPKCKSPNIEMSMVNTGNINAPGKATVSNNINPLKPFTHTNINQNPGFSVNTYGNKCHCKDCGNIFDKPEVFYQ